MVAHPDFSGVKAKSSGYGLRKGKVLSLQKFKMTWNTRKRINELSSGGDGGKVKTSDYGDRENDRQEEKAKSSVFRSP